MRRLDELHWEHPVYGSRRLRALLRREGQVVNRKRVSRLLQIMGIEAIYPRAFSSQPQAGHRICPYLLEGLEITGPNQVWCADITYVPMAYGYMYLVAVMDWWSRYVLGWELSNSQEAEFCVRAVLLRQACAAPKITGVREDSAGFGGPAIGVASGVAP
jgi:putative transposase